MLFLVLHPGSTASCHGKLLLVKLINPLKKCCTYLHLKMYIYSVIRFYVIIYIFAIVAGLLVVWVVLFHYNNLS